MTLREFDSFAVQKRRIFCAILLCLCALLGNGVLSTAHAETKVVEADGQYIVGDGPDENLSVAKERARDAAKRAAIEQAGVYVESNTEVVNAQLTKDEIKTVAGAILRVEEEKITPETKGDIITFHCHLRALVNLDAVDIQKILDNRTLLEERTRLQKENERLVKENEELKAQYKTANANGKTEIDTKIKENETAFTAGQWLAKSYDAINNKKNYAEAIDACNHALLLKSDYADAYINRGVAYDELGQDQRAIDDYSHALQLTPDDADAYYNRGIAYKHLEQPQRAIDDYSHALHLNPDDAAAYINRGGAYDELGQHQRAIND